jgi:hypothetical protein
MKYIILDTLDELIPVSVPTGPAQWVSYFSLKKEAQPVFVTLGISLTETI